MTSHTASKPSTQPGTNRGDAHNRVHRTRRADSFRVFLLPVRTSLVLAVVASLATPAWAAKHPRFEPTDLELERPGTLELDMQFGLVQGRDPYRLVMPDFEVDLGLLSNLELDLDGAFAIEGAPPDGPTIFDHRAPDDLWASVKVGMFDWHDASAQHAWAIGAQLGPKLPTATDDHGVGMEALLLVAQTDGRLHLAFDVGGLVDPHVGMAARPVGFEGGVDVEVELGPSAWSILGELGGVRYVSSDAEQLAATGGVQYSLGERINLSPRRDGRARSRKRPIRRATRRVTEVRGVVTCDETFVIFLFHRLRLHG